MEVGVLMGCVDKYCKWSGQAISMEKSGFFVSKGVHGQFSLQIRNQWGFKKLAQDVKYLGLPLFLSPNKTKDFSFVKEKLEARVSGWKCKSLSWMGRATLIKSVAQVTPIYGMSAFKFPKGLCEEMDAIVRKFWWNPRTVGNKFFTPKAWADLCSPLSEGGLGFRKFESFNEAMIAKLAWWVLSERDSFCVKVLRAKYKVGNHWLRDSPASSASFSWRGIERSRNLLAQAACRLVGSGESILVWEQPWIPDLPNFKPQPRVSSGIPQCLVVAQLLRQDKMGWDKDKLKMLFDEDSVSAILNIPQWSKNQKDRWIWLRSSTGELSVSSAYKEIRKSEEFNQSNPVIGKIWKTSIHERLKMHLWRIASNLLPTKVALAKINPSADTSCPLCALFQETSLHLFWQCSLAKALWFYTAWCIRVDMFQFNDITQVIELLISPPATWNFSKEDCVKLLLTGAIIMDLIWRIRNMVVHDQFKVNMSQLVVELRSRSREHWYSKNTMPDPLLKKQSVKWEVPEQGWYKVNCDAAIGRKFSSIAVVVRDWRGLVVLAQSKKVHTISPLQAEAAAIYWAAQIVADHELSLVYFESDCKQCMDAICNGLESAPWRIQSYLAMLAELSEIHSSWKFRWISRAANEAPHQLAGWTLKNFIWGSFNFCAGPQCFVDACAKDLAGINPL
uniref:RNase H type-1 domain-containing protein n=1 Tax=Fagus sylvatica TaxID=28930 RepID=A0A2N9FKX2_FAGSY